VVKFLIGSPEAAYHSLKRISELVQEDRWKPSAKSPPSSADSWS
jgi:hypothetical protein